MFGFKSCPCKGNTLDKFIQPIILTILAQETIHGYMIIEKIAQTPMFKGTKPDASGVYRYLKSMEKRNLITSYWDIEETGPAKRLYKITNEGAQCLLEWTKTLEDYNHDIESLVGEIKQVLAADSLK
jgi:PadR family transcriptional regulator PadR